MADSLPSPPTVAEEVPGVPATPAGPLAATTSPSHAGPVLAVVGPGGDEAQPTMTSPSEPTDEEVQIQNLTSPRAALSSLRPVEPEPEAPVSATGDTAPALLVYSRRGSCAPAPAVEVDDPATPLPCLPSPKDLFLSKVVKAVGTVLPAPKINKRRTKNPPPDSTPPPPRRSRRKAGLDPENILHIDGSSIWQETFTSVLEQCAKKEFLELMACMQKSSNAVKQLNNVYSPSTFYDGIFCIHSSLTLSLPLVIEQTTKFDEGGHELLGMRFFNHLELCVGQVGLACLDSLVHILIKHTMENTVKSLHTLVDAKLQEDLTKLDDLLGPPMSIPLMGWSSHKQMVKMLHSSWGPLVEIFATIGQLQLVRTLISFKLRSACKVKANTITSAVEVLLSSLHMQKGVIEDEDKTVRFFLHNIKEQQSFCGLFSPLQIIYISEDPPMFLTRLLSLFSISQLSRYVLDVHLGNLTSPLKRSTADFSAVIIGLGAILQQFDSFYMSQYIQAPKAVFWLMSLCKYMDISRDVVESCLPASALAILQQ
nr:unnamed protein product [Digitaria exilis]